VTHLRAGIVAHTTACNKDAFRKPVLRCVARRHSLIGHLEHNSWRRPLRQGSLGQPTAAPRALRACILCFAARGSFKTSALTSRLAKVVGAPCVARATGACASFQVMSAQRWQSQCTPHHGQGPNSRR
jgi:hypothetical protein